MSLLTNKKYINVNYDKIKAGCKRKKITLKKLCEMLGITRQNLHNRVMENKLKKEYVEKIEKELCIFYEE